MAARKRDPNYHGPLTPPSGRHNKRADFIDYTEPRIYMFTIKKSPACPDFSLLTGDPRLPVGAKGAPAVIHLEAGGILGDELKKTELMRPLDVKILNSVIMPDHAHLLVRVLRKLTVKITSIIAAVESATTRRCRKAGLIAPDASAFSGEGINDIALYARGQLDRLYKYIDDNPRRLMIKRLHPDLFGRELGLQIGELEMDAVGNMFLLRKPLMAVHVRRKWTEAEREEYRERCLAFARHGGVLISPFISPHERAIMREALEEGGSVIQIYERGFGERWKPAGRMFDICAEGRLLVMTESWRTTRAEDMSYRKASHMNRVAEYIAIEAPRLAMRLRGG